MRLVILPLLVAEELAQREDVLAIDLIEQANHFGGVGLVESLHELLLVLIGMRSEG